MSGCFNRQPGGYLMFTLKETPEETIDYEVFMCGWKTQEFDTVVVVLVR